ncbi:MDR family oxidoreductase [Ferrimonas balearica]|uniref:acrylyl-CoA reductase (NADPH) n=1 Tax=Ferrimonas balearica TaxID=44012 RepID=UPI001C9906A5|nr:MDR family oxidoreductase [Ferrimonas balearica]MBY5993046.1 oxidoreductase [Ferrimonas balearica]
MFKALQLRQDDAGKTQAEIVQLEDHHLPQGNVTVEVQYSSLNYKDGLAVTGTGKIIRDFPMVPGIDFVGTVTDSEDPRYQSGDAVILTGWGVGERHWGGMSQRARVQGDWLVPLPQGMSPEQAMAIGTAGLTAMLCVQALEQAGVRPEQGPILVTGASGGVGSVAVTLLAKAGFEVHAITGREDNADWLKGLGAHTVLPRSQFEGQSRPLDKALWAGAVDTVGGEILAKVLSQMAYDGAVAACGLAASFSLPTTVMPFILRGVKLLGVDSVMCPFERRQAAWNRLLKDLGTQHYDAFSTVASLEEVPQLAQQIIQGQVRGRVLIKP